MKLLRRYWWLLVIGATVGEIVALVGARAQSVPVRHTAQATALVTSSDAAYFRTGQPTAASNGESAQNADDRRYQMLVDAANLYPLLIKSDRVAQLRDQIFGQTPGTVDSRAIFAIQTATGFRASSIPVIEINGNASTKKDALALANHTVEAFRRYVQAQQKSARVARAQRIRIQPLTSGRIIESTGGTSYGLAGLLGLAVFIAFVGFAFILDSLRCRASPIAPSEPASNERA
jgi:hypothetical protein